jgi:Glyoxalase-like domain
MNATRIVTIVLCGMAALAGQAVAAGLGIGRGIDHVGVLVRLDNFAAEADVLTQQLGFAATPVLQSPEGVENRLVWFDDLSYLELDAITADNAGTAPFLAFLAQHEGAKFYGTQVLNATQAIGFLDGAGYPNVGPIPAGPLTIQSSGQVVGQVPLWDTIILTQRIAPDNSNFFLAYDQAQVHDLFVAVPALAPRPHPNTAQHIQTVWLVVSDLDAARPYFTGLGLSVGTRPVRIGYLGAWSLTVNYHNANLVLLQPDGPGLAADFAADRGEGILGFSVQVGNLETAHRLVQGGTGLTLPIFNYRGHDRFLIPASATHGVLLEMVE